MGEDISDERLTELDAVIHTKQEQLDATRLALCSSMHMRSPGTMQRSIAWLRHAGS